VWRVIEIPSNRTLGSLNKAICNAYDRWDNQLWSFFFGMPGKRGTQEYVTYRDPRRFGRKTKSGHEAKLKFLPLNDHPQFYYVWSYEQQWWHRIEFLGIHDVDPDVTYPRVVESQGFAPPVHIDFLAPQPADESVTINVGMDKDRRVTYAELDASLKTRPKALSTPEVIGYLRGAVSAANIVMPSRYWGLLLGNDPFESTEQLADLQSLLFSLHNQLADSISSGVPVVLRRSFYPVTREGLLLFASDLRMEMQGFRRGLDMGQSNPDDLDKEGMRAMMAMVEADTLLEGVEDFQRRNTVLKPAEIKQIHKQVLGVAEVVDTIMMDLGIAFRSTRKQTIENTLKTATKTEVRRNDPCPCGSGKKYKACCLDKIRQTNPENN
ncbi:hypothetical protein EHM69_13415, partial [candidate division KSB1 bacterium]